MAAFVNVGASVSGAERDDQRQRADRELRSPVRAGGRHPAGAVVSGRRVGPAEDAVEGRPDPAAGQPRLPRERAVLAGDLRRPPCRPRLRDARDARRDHAGRDGRVPPRALRSRPRRDRVRRRHHAGRGTESRRGQARWLDQARHAEAGGRRPDANRRPQGLHGRAAQLGADHADRRDAVADAQGSGLRAAAGGESRPRRHHGPAVPAPARREGLHLRHRQRHLGDATSAATGRRRRRSGPR